MAGRTSDIDKEQNAMFLSDLTGHELQALTIGGRIPWPLAMVIDSDSLSLYNSVLAHLMQVKPCSAFWKNEPCCIKRRIYLSSGNPTSNYSNLYPQRYLLSTDRLLIGCITIRLGYALRMKPIKCNLLVEF